MCFSKQAWARVTALYEAILHHPFNLELAEGTLDPARFRHYLVQDSRYLEAFSRTLALAAAHAPTPDERLFFVRSAQESVRVEGELHATLFRELGVDPEAAARARPSPACAQYADFLLRLGALGPYEALLAGLLPCFWIYWEVGKSISARRVSPNPYGTWIDTYAGEEYGRVVREMIRWTDQRAEGASPELRGRMMGEFVTATRLEWRFWEGAYRLETWSDEGT